MRTVREISKLTGVSVRTLQYYDAIGLLKPTNVSQAGYRMYDDTALIRLQNILLFRELQFSLKEIKTILDSPNFDLSETITQQIKLLELKRKYIGELIDFAREIQKKGVKTMNFNVFSNGEIEQYKKEAKAIWGSTEEYREYENKSAAQNHIKRNKTEIQLMKIFAEIGALRHMSPAKDTVQEKIAALQKFITDNYYECTKAILSELGQMYVSDERFRKNIDKTGGEGTAEFVRQAISVYCAG